MRLLLIVLLACGGEEKKAEPAPVQTIVRKVAVQPPSPDDVELVGTTPVDVTLAFANISSIHQGFFMNSKAVQRLGQELGSCFERSATVEVGYSNENLKGRIVLIATPDTGLCKPMISEDRIDLRPWIPVGKALARYRDYVAGTSDFRISNFEVGIRIERAGGLCYWTIGGQHPPDGTLWSACPETGSKEPCASEQQEKDQFEWSSLADEKATRACFSSKD